MKIKRFKWSTRTLWAFEGEGDGGDAGGGASGVEIVTGADEGVSANVSAGGGEGGGGSDFSTLIPDGFKDKPYMENILKAENPSEEFFKQFDGLQSKLGQRPANLPQEDAAQEEWDKYYETVRPKEVDEYSIPDIDLGEDATEQLKESVKHLQDDDFLKAMKQSFHKHGLTKRQAEGVAQDYQQLFFEGAKGQIKAVADAQAEMDASFEKLGKEILGGEMDKALDVTKGLLKANLSEGVDKHLGGLPNEALLVMADFARNVNKKYIKEDTDTPGDTADDNTSLDILNAEQQKLMADESYKNKFHNQHDATMVKVRELTNKIAAAKKRQR